MTTSASPPRVNLEVIVSVDRLPRVCARAGNPAVTMQQWSRKFMADDAGGMRLPTPRQAPAACTLCTGHALMRSGCMPACCWRSRQRPLPLSLLCLPFIQPAQQAFAPQPVSRRTRCSCNSLGHSPACRPLLCGYTRRVGAATGSQQCSSQQPPRPRSGPRSQRGCSWGPGGSVQQRGRPQASRCSSRSCCSRFKRPRERGGHLSAASACGCAAAAGAAAAGRGESEEAARLGGGEPASQPAGPLRWLLPPLRTGHCTHAEGLGSCVTLWPAA